MPNISTCTYIKHTVHTAKLYRVIFLPALFPACVQSKSQIFFMASLGKSSERRRLSPWFDLLELENHHGRKMPRSSATHTCYERMMVLPSCSRIATRDPATAILNSKTFCNELAGRRTELRQKRMPSSAWVHRVLVLFFVRQAIQVAGNITDI